MREIATLVLFTCFVAVTLKAQITGLREGLPEPEGDDLPASVLIPRLREDNPTMKAAVLDALGQTGEKIAVPYAIAALNDMYPDVRIAATKALGRLRDASAVEALTDRSRNDPRMDVRIAAIDALGEIGDRSAVPALTNMLTEPRLRASALTALGKLQAEQTRQVIRQCLNDSSVAVREAAARALGMLRVGEETVALKQLLQDSDWKVRWAAAETLSRWSDAQGCSILTAGLDAEAEDHRIAAARALAAAGVRQAVPKLMEKVTTCEGFEREDYLRALATLRADEAYDLFVDGLSNEWFGTRLAALEGIAALGRRESLTLVERMTNDVERAVRMKARKVLRELAETTSQREDQR